MENTRQRGTRRASRRRRLLSMGRVECLSLRGRVRIYFCIERERVALSLRRRAHGTMLLLLGDERESQREREKDTRGTAAANRLLESISSRGNRATE